MESSNKDKDSNNNANGFVCGSGSGSGDQDDDWNDDRSFEDDDEVRVIDVKMKKIYWCKLCGKFGPGIVEIRKHFREVHIEKKTPKPPEVLVTPQGIFARSSGSGTDNDNETPTTSSTMENNMSLDVPTSEKPSEPDWPSDDDADTVILPRTPKHEGDKAIQAAPEGNLKRSWEENEMKPLSLASTATATSSKRMRMEETPMPNTMDLGSSNILFGLLSSSQQRPASLGAPLSMKPDMKTNTNTLPPATATATATTATDEPETEAETDTEPEPEEGSAKIFTCNRCTFQFPSLESLKSHALLEHVRSRNGGRGSDVKLAYTTSAPDENPPALELPVWRRRRGRKCGVCKCEDYIDDEMISCDNPFCQKKSFHLDCINMTKKPEGKWFCGWCSRL